MVLGGTVTASWNCPPSSFHDDAIRPRIERYSPLARLKFADRFGRDGETGESRRERLRADAGELAEEPFLDVAEHAVVHGGAGVGIPGLGHRGPAVVDDETVAAELVRVDMS